MAARMLRWPRLIPKHPYTYMQSTEGGARTGGDQDAALAGLELVERAQALGLAHLPVDGQRVEAQVAQQQRQLARAVARARKHDRRRARQLRQEVRQVAVLRMLRFKFRFVGLGFVFRLGL